MLRVALKMLLGDRAEARRATLRHHVHLILVTFAANRIPGGFSMTPGSALSAKIRQQIWVMDPAVSSAQQTTQHACISVGPCSQCRGRTVSCPFGAGSAEVRLPNGAFQTFQVDRRRRCDALQCPFAQGCGVAPSLRSPDAGSSIR